MEKTYYCPTCDGELERLSGCGAVGYFCNHCRLLVSRQKMLAVPTIDWSHAMLLVVDMQNGLLSRNVWHKVALIENVNNLIDFFHGKRSPVVFARHTNTGFSKINEPAWEICPCMHIGEEDRIFNKIHSSIFGEKEFLAYLDEGGTFGHEINWVVVCGLVSNGCVKAACEDGLKRGIHVILPEDGHSTFHQEGEAMVSRWNESLAKAGVVVATTKQIIG